MPDPGRPHLLVRALALIGFCALLALGVVGAVASPGFAVGGAFCAALTGVAAAVRVRDASTGSPAARAAAGRQVGLVVGCKLTIGSMVGAGSAVLLGPATAVLLLAPLMIGGAWWLRHPRPAPPHTVDDLPLQLTPPPVPPAPELSTAQLCLAWHHSYFALLDLPADASRADLVHRRQQLLDEIERRDPAGFTRWIDTDARPGSNPGRYVVGGE